MLNWALALASAVLLVFTFPKFNVTMLAPVALTPMLVALLREPRPGRRFLLGWTSGIVYWFGVCYWIQFVLSFHGGVGDTGGWALFSLFAVAKALHTGVFALLAGILMRRWWAIPAVAALWVAVEVTHGPLGFAWLALGNAGIGMSIPLRLAPFTGVYGLSFVFVMLSTALALPFLGRPRRELLWLAALPLLLLLPDMPPAERGHDTAILLQPDISETQEWTSASVDYMQRRQVALTLRAALADPETPPSIVVWPEVPAPLYYYDDRRFRGYVDSLARTIRAHVLLGVVSHAPDGAPLNSATLVSPEGVPVSRYDKVNLVPFGEFVPWPLGALTRKISTEAGDFAAGTRVVVSPVNGHKIGAFICYESVFPNFVRKFADGGAEVLFNISNDGWFGRSAARQQHLEIVRMRAAENRRWILRSTNDGITATIDSAGRLRGTLPLYVEAASHSGFTYISSRTVYTRFGDWFPALCAVLALLCLVGGRLFY
ncbi:MAG TPA: apolipoprotein N-acyltransferase [Bryobacteraceae bacterium]|nr:apolipoprotein N-acyltransferase [Bryobacteraceae bacterium]